jgi:hypothetical protein
MAGENAKAGTRGRQPWKQTCSAPSLVLAAANTSARKERPVQGVQPMSGAEHAFLLIDRASFLQ